MSFFEFNIAVSGLFAAQRGLSVTGNNISNASTKDYSRQVLAQEADTPLSGIGVGMTGTGVRTIGVSRVRDSYIDLKLWSQNPKLGEYNVKVTQSALVEGAFGEPSDTGFTKVFNNMFSAMNSICKDPTSGDAAVALRENMISFAEYYSNISETLKSFQQDLNYEIKATVDEINILGARIQSLNNQIAKAEMYGDEANSFRDERDACVDRLSEIIDVKATEEEKLVNGKTIKTFSVQIAGQTLVDNLNLNTLSVLPRGTTETYINQDATSLRDLTTKLLDGTDTTPIATLEADMAALVKKLKEEGATVTPSTITVTKAGVNYTTTQYEVSYSGKTVLDNSNVFTDLVSKNQNEEDVDGLYDIKWSNGLTFNMANDRMSGELKGLIDMRDGCGTGSAVTYNGIPYYIGRLDDYVRQFAMTMNEAYSTDENGYIKVAANADGISHITRKNGSTQYYTYNVATGAYDEVSPALIDGTGDNNDTTYMAEKALFTYNPGDTTGIPVASSDLLNYTQITASNFSISKEIYEGAHNLKTTYDPSNESDGTFFSTLYAQKDNKKMFAEGTPSDYMVSIFSELGINAEEAKMYLSTQEAVTAVIKNQRSSVSQVDLTEEFSNLIKYQQAYQAAAKMITTIDEIYQTTIFKLGNF